MYLHTTSPYKFSMDYANWEDMCISEEDLQ